MVFFVSVAADVYARKHNVRLEFATTPTITELINAAESQYDITARASRPAGYPDIPFRIQTFQVYDDVLMRWVDLYSSAQLVNGCQVYAFQPETVWNVDVQGTIPVARDTVTWSSTVGSPRRARLAADHGIPPSMSEKLRSVFYDLDVGNKGFILYTDLKNAFLRTDIEFSYQTIGELFSEADRNRDGHVSYEEWVRFAIDHPNIIDALFFRSRDLVRERPAYIPTTTEIISDRRLREAELDRLYRESHLSVERARAQREYEDAKREADLARTRAQVAAERERAALDKLYFTPTSPNYGYR
jgi:hypothetical protein